MTMQREVRDQSRIPPEKIAWLDRRADAFARIGADGRTPTQRAVVAAGGGPIGAGKRSAKDEK